METRPAALGDLLALSPRIVPACQEVLSESSGNREEVGQHPLAGLEAPGSGPDHRHLLLRRIGVDVDGIEQPINAGQRIAQWKR
jgi:hypothetical protein